MVTTAELADAQGGMRTLVDKDLEEFFASLDLSKPEFARDAMLEQVPVIIGSYSAMSAAVAADYYDELRSEEHTSELQSRENLVCRLLLGKKNTCQCMRS